MLCVHCELISGVVLGAEHVEGAALGDDDISHYVSIDLLIFRIVLEFFN